MAAKMQPHARSLSVVSSFSTACTTAIPTQLTVKEEFTKSQPCDKKGKWWNELINAVTYFVGLWLGGSKQTLVLHMP